MVILSLGKIIFCNLSRTSWAVENSKTSVDDKFTLLSPFKRFMWICWMREKNIIVIIAYYNVFCYVLCTSPFSWGLKREKDVMHVIFGCICNIFSLWNVGWTLYVCAHSSPLTAKYCHGWYWTPPSVDLSRIQFPGLDEMPNLIMIYETW